MNDGMSHIIAAFLAASVTNILWLRAYNTGSCSIAVSERIVTARGGNVAPADNANVPVIRDKVPVIRLARNTAILTLSELGDMSTTKCGTLNDWIAAQDSTIDAMISNAKRPKTCRQVV